MSSPRSTVTATSGDVPGATVPLDVERLRREFPALARQVHGQPLTYLDNATTTQVPDPVIDAVTDYYRRYGAGVHRATHTLGEEATRAYEAARGVACRFLGARDSREIVFVRGATEALNLLASTYGHAHVGVGDEILVTNHAYGACRNAAAFTAERHDVRLVTAEVPFPLEGPGVVVDRVLAAVTDRTRLVMLDHVTSPTGLVLPIEPIVRACNERGVETLIDGAHAPGMLPLDLAALGATYYTGNCHKWLCTPKGSALLHVRRDRQQRVRPLAISHGANSPREDRSRFRLEFDFSGTGDYTPFLCVPAALRFLEGLLAGGVPALQQHNRELALAGRDLLCEALGVTPPAPDAMIASLASVVLPWSEEPLIQPQGLDPLQVTLWDLHRVEVPVMRWPAPSLRLLRISPQAYNDIRQYRYLADLLKTYV